jgi:4-aminobutyrate aminotransferase-like enzyme
MLLPIQADQVEQDFEPLLGRETPVIGAVRGVGLCVAVEPADDTLHVTILASFPQAPRHRIHYNQ